jgi:uncharacterized membrane protein
MILDGIWIYSNSNYYISLCKKIQKEPFVLKIPSIIITYIILIIGLYLYCKFIINELKLNKNINKYLLTFIYGMLFGVAIYGTYSFTSCTYYKNYSYYNAFLDTIWGMILFTLSGLFFISFN